MPVLSIPLYHPFPFYPSPPSFRPPLSIPLPSVILSEAKNLLPPNPPESPQSPHPLPNPNPNPPTRCPEHPQRRPQFLLAFLKKSWYTAAT